MRKLYVLLTGFALLQLLSLPANARTLTPDVANFSFTIDPPTSNVTFTNTSSLGNEPGERRAFWSFGDGTGQWTAALAGTQHHYQSTGTYTVCLKIYRIRTNSNDSILSAQVCKTVVIESVCHANFETVASTTNPAGRYFIVQPSHNQNKKPVRICWTFGDNHDTCIQYSTTYTGTYGVYHLYGQAGSYNVCVKILYDGGCEAHECHIIQIATNECRADFERIPFTSVANPLTAGFRALPWHSGNNKPSRICWTFGDGSPETCINYGQDYTGSYTTSHTYAQPGHYEVCVKILYYGGCEARKCKTIEVNRPDSCTADFERIPVTATNTGLSTYFRALLWHNNNKKPARICWTFGDNRDTCINYGQDYNGPYVVNHTYQQPGQYEVCIKILYYGGCEAIKCKLVVVPQVSCAVNIFEITPSINSPERNFVAVVSSTPPHAVERICWTFGDGEDTCIVATSSTTPVALSVHHNYPGPGVYHVCVRVLFQGGCVAESCKEIVIRSNTDRCGGYMTDSLIAPRTFKFNGFAIHNPNDPVVSLHWTFGDGTAANGPEVTHTYNNAGEYRVCLTIVTQSGCETRICNTVRVAGNNQTGLILTPNPVSTILHALFFSTHNETVTIKIINSTGVVVRNYTRSVTVGGNNWDFDVASLVPGPYLFTVQSPNQLASALFLKQ